MPESKKIDQDATGDQLTERNPVSAVKLSAALTARVDAWALTHAINRSEAIRQLVELGLKPEATPNVRRVSRHEAIAVEQMAASQIDQFIDPAISKEERERRIHRLTEGPPEFVELRVDLPGRGY